MRIPARVSTARRQGVVLDSRAAAASLSTCRAMGSRHPSSGLAAVVAVPNGRQPGSVRAAGSPAAHFLHDDRPNNGRKTTPRLPVLLAAARHIGDAAAPAGPTQPSISRRTWP